EKIAAKGIYRDGVRSSKSHFVKASGLCWISLMWLTNIPWAQRVWAFSFLTGLAPSERYYQTCGRKPKKSTDFARQMVFQWSRWLPDKALVVIGDNAYSGLDFLHAYQSLTQSVTLITRLRLDAALYEPAPVRQPKQKGHPRLKGKRLPTPRQVADNPHTLWTRRTLSWYDQPARTIEFCSFTVVWYHTGLSPVPVRYVLMRDVLGKFDPQALLSTDLALTPLLILTYFIRRW
ncbi:MAG: transposase, partial [Chloroflexota bacterium]